MFKAKYFDKDVLVLVFQNDATLIFIEDNYVKWVDSKFIELV